jgi:hypothetical protein
MTVGSRAGFPLAGGVIDPSGPAWGCRRIPFAIRTRPDDGDDGE